MRTTFLLFLSCFCFIVSISAADGARPNVLLLYYDDLGFGDLGANHATGLDIPEDSKYLDSAQPTLTPNLDALAAQGLRFTNAHSADGVCTPSRYAILTGRYAWRTRLKRGVLGGYSAPLLEAERLTMGKLFQQQGYKTAMVGKWHLGMQFFAKDGSPVDLGNDPTVLENDRIDFSKPLASTPYHAGFDYFFGTPASLDMPPYAWIESAGGQVCMLTKGGIVVDGQVDFSQAQFATNDSLEEGNSGYSRRGVYDPSFKHADYLQIQAKKVSDLVQKWHAEEESFFIYMPSPAPHTPHAVQERFAGSAGFAYGDYLVQTDYYAGEVLRALGDPADPNSAAANTIVIVTSDNGPEKGATQKSLEVKHDANGPYRGIKRDNWEGGTRVPFIVRWPGVAQAGTTTDYPCSQVDIFATLVEVMGIKVPDGTAEDSVSFLDVLKGAGGQDRGEPFIEHSAKGQFAIVDAAGEWKFINGTKSGGNDLSFDADNLEIKDALGKVGGEPGQLYHLKDDPGERANLLLGSPSNAITDKKAELVQQLRDMAGEDAFPAAKERSKDKSPVK